MTRTLSIRFATSLVLFAALCSTLAPATRAANVRDALTADNTPVAARIANGTRGSGLHSLGLVPNPAAPRADQISPSAFAPAVVPASMDLSQYAPPVGDQGGVGSCTAWASGYYLRGWYAKRDGYFPAGGSGNTGSFAPMYTYSQIVHGQNTGTSYADNLNIQKSQGIDSRADYTQGDYNFTSLPTSAETASASHIRIASFQDVSGSNLQGWIQSTMAGGNPVAISLPVYPEFDNASASSPLVGLPHSGETSRGNHAVFAAKYDANGLWIENSWGTSYGLNGWSELSWSFVNQYVFEAVSMATQMPGSSVPSEIHQTSSVASSAVHAAGFNVTIASAPDSTCNYIGKVIRQSPAGGAWAIYNSTVTLTIGQKPSTPCP